MSTQLNYLIVRQTQDALVSQTEGASPLDPAGLNESTARRTGTVSRLVDALRLGLVELGIGPRARLERPWLEPTSELERMERCEGALKSLSVRRGRVPSQPRLGRWALVQVWDGAALASFDHETSARKAMAVVDDDEVVVLYVARDIAKPPLGSTTLRAQPQLADLQASPLPLPQPSPGFR